MIKNLLPFPLHIYIRNPFEKEYHFIKNLASQETITKPNNLHVGDDLVAAYTTLNQSANTRLNPLNISIDSICVPHMKTVYNGAPQILLGSSYYDTFGDHSYKLNAFKDIAGVWIHNHLPLILNVYYNKQHVATIHPTNYPKLFFDNYRQGLSIGDILTFRAVIDNNQTVPLYHIQLSDQYVKNIHVGDIQQSGCVNSNIYIDPDVFVTSGNYLMSENTSKSSACQKFDNFVYRL